MILSVYNWNLYLLYFLVVLAIVSWAILGVFLDKTKYKLFNALVLVVSVFIILRLTIIGRTTFSKREFMFFIDNKNELWREMFMNAILYLPFGVSLSALIRYKSVIAGFLLSLIIEAWQYYAAIGVAQGTDVIMNTLGCAFGILPIFLIRYFNKINLKERSIAKAKQIYKTIKE